MMQSHHIDLLQLFLMKLLCLEDNAHTHQTFNATDGLQVILHANGTVEFNGNTQGDTAGLIMEFIDIINQIEQVG